MQIENDELRGRVEALAMGDQNDGRRRAVRKSYGARKVRKIETDDQCMCIRGLVCMVAFDGVCFFL